MTEAAFFDLDKTIIAKSSVLAFGKPFYREGLLSKGAIVKSIYAQIVFMLVGADEAKMEKLREAMLSLTKGWNQQHIADIVRETLDEVISPIVFAEALELFDQHHAAGRRVVIVSSAPFEVVGPLGEFLGADEVIATRAEIDDDGNYTGELAVLRVRAVQGRRRSARSPSARASTSPRRTRTATRSPTCRCSRRSAIRSP